MIPSGVEIGKEMSLRRSLRRGSTTEMPKTGLDTSVIKNKTIWRKREGGRGGGEGLRMVATYTQVENALGMHLRYMHIM